MTRRNALSLLAIFAALHGCASNQVQPQEKEEPLRTYSIGWVNGDWRICEENECPKATPKTVVLMIEPGQGKKVAEQKVEAKVVLHYAPGKITPSGKWQEELLNFVKSLTLLDVIRIASYTDNTGTQELNEKLARRRAEYIRDWLRARKVKNLIEIEAKGACCFVAPNSTDEGRFANRRTEVYTSRKEDR